MVRNFPVTRSYTAEKWDVCKDKERAKVSLRLEVKVPSRASCTVRPTATGVSVKHLKKSSAFEGQRSLILNESSA